MLGYAIEFSGPVILVRKFSGTLFDKLGDDFVYGIFGVNSMQVDSS